LIIFIFSPINRISASRKKPTASSRKKKSAVTNEINNRGKNKSSSSSTSSKSKSKSPAKSARKKSSKTASKKKGRKTPVKEVEVDDESSEEDEEVTYVARIGKIRPQQNGKNTKNHLKESTFHHHYRAPNASVSDGKGGKKKNRKAIVCWTGSEIDALTRGQKALSNRWTQILEDYRAEFNECRTTVDLKDKYSNICKKENRRIARETGVPAPPSKKKRKVTKTESEHESSEAEEEEEEEQIFEGDLRIRIMFGKKGKMWKLLGAGHHSYGDIIDGARETFAVKSHNGDITVASGLLKGEEDDVELTDAIGATVPLPWNSNSKPVLYIVVRTKGSI